MSNRVVGTGLCFIGGEGELNGFLCHSSNPVLLVRISNNQVAFSEWALCTQNWGKTDKELRGKKLTESVMKISCMTSSTG